MSALSPRLATWARVVMIFSLGAPIVGDTAFSEATGMPAGYESAIWATTL
ncbi:hypothetical protein RSOL_083440 [Rhizoctonia solani AG-3 Rhs1AP]|uniref:Transmembrane protein n=1 Tax=Rhizoctonia solani AG-3 Rhs1AP TaxID=1086054 RepID=X8IZD3_9AGAM|nr:hypothetical protein RSOL_083440 [Rhizoctonia solani AG-3 Rhs1AP]